MKHTALYERHLKLGARMAEFAGWEMPIRYAEGTIHEHNVVRDAVGIFDVSHMGRIVIRGPETEKLLDMLSTNKISGTPIGKAVYTVWCDESGGCVDDLIIYHLAPQEYFIIVNAGNREKDLQHLQKYAAGRDVVVDPRYEQDGVLALQGPKASAVVEELFPEAAGLKPMRLKAFDLEGQQVVVARTGYTGENGFELIARNAVIPTLWDLCMQLGETHGIEPIGLGARDTLRLEMGFALYGHELSDEIFPTESVSSWTVKMAKDNFVGKAAIEKKQPGRKACGVVYEGQGIPREGCRVLQNGEQIGIVTSGNKSPTLQKTIALLLVDHKLEEGEQVEIEVRQRIAPATVVALPFLKSVAKQNT